MARLSSPLIAITRPKAIKLARSTSPTADTIMSMNHNTTYHRPPMRPKQKTSPPNKSARAQYPIVTTMRGTAQALFAFSRATKRDIEGYVSGLYAAIDKDHHESTKLTGKKVIFYLSLTDKEDDDLPLSARLLANIGLYIEDDDTDVIIPCIEVFTPSSSSASHHSELVDE